MKYEQSHKLFAIMDLTYKKIQLFTFILLITLRLEYHASKHETPIWLASLLISIAHTAAELVEAAVCAIQ